MSKKIWPFVFFVSCLAFSSVVIAVFVLDDARINSSSHILGEFITDPTDRSISLNKSVYGLDRIDLEYAEGGNSISYKARLWKDGVMIGNAFGSHPGYFGFKDVDNDGHEEIVAGGFGRRKTMRVYKIKDNSVYLVQVTPKARFFCQLALFINNFGLLIIVFSSALIFVSFPTVIEYMKAIEKK